MRTLQNYDHWCIKKVNKSSNWGILWNNVCSTRHQRSDITLRRMQQPPTNNKAVMSFRYAALFPSAASSISVDSIRSLTTSFSLVHSAGWTSLKKLAMTNLAFLHKINHKKVGIVSLALILIPSFLGFFLVPKLLRGQLKKVKFPGKTKQFAKLIFSFFWIIFPTQNLALKPGSEIRELWSEAPFAVTFKVYVFNITNPHDVVQGRKVCSNFILYRPRKRATFLL